MKVFFSLSVMRPHLIARAFVLGICDECRNRIATVGCAWRSGTRAVALIVTGLLTACAVGPDGVPPTLEPEANAMVWPLPPETARYALVRELIGERDFATTGTEVKGTIARTLSWIAGIIVGESDQVELRRPVSGLTDAAGNVYVVDASHKAVVVFDMLEADLKLWRWAARSQPFASPVGIASDGVGGFLVTDSELGEVIRLDARGEPVGGFGKGIVDRPTGIARDDETGLIYVADTRAHDIKIFEDSGLLFDTLGGRGTEPGLFNAPTHLAFSDGSLYVADTLNFRVQVFDRAGDGRLAFGRIGLFIGNMTRPKGIAVGGGGRIYVVESYFDHLLVFDRQGRLLLPIGGTGAEAGYFFLPSGVWTDAAGRVYVADMYNGRVTVLKELTALDGT